MANEWDDVGGGIFRLMPDARPGELLHTLHTMAGAGTPTVFAVPNTARGFRLYPSADITFAVDEAPTSGGTATSGGGTIAAAALATGGRAESAKWESRLLNDGTCRELTLEGIAGSETVTVEFF